MALSGISDAMKQYSRSADEAMKTREPVRKGLKMPDSTILVSIVAVLFVVLVLVGEMMG